MVNWKKYRANFIICLIYLTYTLLSFGFYQERTLNGEMDNHILAAEMFGIPAELKERGIKPLYYGPSQAGWDGQFYYYMSNDIFALKDTANHVDAPSYRYQRVGLSLYAAIIATVFGMDWVSPITFFTSYLFLILAAIWAGASLLSRLGAYPALILLWALSVGTQITLFNALPDAAADAFLILALTALHAKRYALSAIPFAFAALSREVYVLFPTFILLFFLVDFILNARASKDGDFRNLAHCLLKWKGHYLLVLPGVVAVVWHFYVVQHFGVSPAEQAHNILGYPLVAWKNYFLSGVNGNHKLVGSGLFAYKEACSLFLFLVVLVIALWLSLRTFVKKRYSSVSPEVRGVALTSICFVFLYASFGSTVIAHYTGYFKAIAVFFFIIPLLLVVTNVIRKKRIFVYLLLIFALSFTTFYNMEVRILPFSTSEDQYTKLTTVTEARKIECFGKYDAKIKINDIKIVKGSILSNLFGRGDLIVINLELINTGEYAFISTRNFGSTFMSYHWVDEHGKVIMDGIRSAIPGTVQPGQSVQVQVVSPFPEASEELYLKLSPVQERCAWFYLANPETSADLLRFSAKN